MLHQLVISSTLMLTMHAAGAAIYTCTDKSGRRHTADRPIAACAGQEHRVLNPDGSLQRILPAAMSPRERLDAERRQREAEREQFAREEAIKRDRLLLRRYPTEADHQAARQEALRQVHGSVEATERRLAELEKERKPLEARASGLAGQAMPADLKQKLDANDAMVKAQRSLVQNHELEAARINAVFDREAQRLLPMWKAAD